MLSDILAESGLGKEIRKEWGYLGLGSNREDLAGPQRHRRTNQDWSIGVGGILFIENKETAVGRQLGDTADQSLPQPDGEMC